MSSIVTRSSSGTVAGHRRRHVAGGIVQADRMAGQQLQPRLAQQGDDVRQRPAVTLAWMVATWSRCISPVMRIEPPVTDQPAPFVRRCRPDEKSICSVSGSDDPQHRLPLHDRRHRAQPGHRQAAAFQRTARPSQRHRREIRVRREANRRARRCATPAGDVLQDPGPRVAATPVRPQHRQVGERRPGPGRATDPRRSGPVRAARCRWRSRFVGMRSPACARNCSCAASSRMVSGVPEAVRLAPTIGRLPAPIRSVPGAGLQGHLRLPQVERRPEIRRRLGGDRGVQRRQEAEPRGRPAPALPVPTGVSRAVRWVSAASRRKRRGAGQPCPLVAKRQRHIQCSVDAALRAAGQGNVRLRCLPGRAERAVDHGHRGVMDAHPPQLAEPAGAGCVAVARGVVQARRARPGAGRRSAQSAAQLAAQSARPAALWVRRRVTAARGSGCRDRC